MIKIKSLVYKPIKETVSTIFNNIMDGFSLQFQVHEILFLEIQLNLKL